VYGFTVPDGFKHDTSADDQGSVSATSSFGDPPYIDVYTDRTTASAQGALATVAADLRRDEAAHGGNLDAGTRSRTVSGHDVVEWTGSFPKDDANDPATMVTAVVLIGSDSMEIDYSDDPDSFEFDSAERAINTVVASLHRQ
jgi:hypothetical protein